MRTVLTTEASARGSPRAPSAPTSPEPSPPTPAHAASLRRHPSSMNRPRSVSCMRCGFQLPDHATLAAEIAAIPQRWRPVLIAASADELEGAARLRDELHVVANRIRRLRAAPGSSILANVSVDAATALSRTPNVAHLLAMLSVSAERLADLLLRLEPEEWDVRGRVGTREVTVAELVLMPLHRSHARLTQGAACP